MVMFIITKWFHLLMAKMVWHYMIGFKDLTIQGGGRNVCVRVFSGLYNFRRIFNTKP